LNLDLDLVRGVRSAPAGELAMSANEPGTNASEVVRLAAELEEAELYEQRLRSIIVAVRDELAAGNTARALSMCNQALNEIDSATDVVAPSPRTK
jgi:hypothetical protein